jgi:hypothetical protein
LEVCDGMVLICDTQTCCLFHGTLLPLLAIRLLPLATTRCFPDGILVGIISEATLKEEAPFWDIRLELSQDFGRLSFVEIIKSRLKNEQDSLKQVTIGDPK